MNQSPLNKTGTLVGWLVGLGWVGLGWVGLGWVGVGCVGCVVVVVVVVVRTWSNDDVSGDTVTQACT